MLIDFDWVASYTTNTDSGARSVEKEIDFMEHLIESSLFFQDKIFLRGFVFGLVHVTIMLIGFYTGWSINRLLKVVSNGFLAGITGAVVAHVIADLVASLLDPHIRPATLGILLGGLAPLPLIPILEKYVTKSRYHVVVGDHEDVIKDMSEKHRD